ncbi:MAG: DUF1489 domain-containing protein [Fimbriimonadaceae bacterium]|nr:DUF1489 domain-containing protein [Alphaproteobacteria bacterium]
MTLNLIKLCVGCPSIEQLEEWQSGRLADMRQRGVPAQLKHTTRMTPKRRDELLDGGSLYWVIKGAVQVRQVLTDIRSFTDDEGIKRCDLMLDPELVATIPRRFRPFQGWRYFPGNDAPPDLPSAGGDFSDMPPALRQELAELGLI